MIDAYKRYTIWNFKILGHVPGFKRYSKFMIKHYEKNFKRTFIISMVVSVAANIGLQFWAKKIQQQEREIRRENS